MKLKLELNSHKSEKILERGGVFTVVFTSVSEGRVVVFNFFLKISHAYFVFNSKFRRYPRGD